MLLQTRLETGLPELMEMELQIQQNVPPVDTTEVSVPAGVREGTYNISVPLIRPSKLTTSARGGVGKNLSEGWNLNFAVGCTHACPFCYVDPIHKRFGVERYGEIVRSRWGNYFLVPSNLDDAIASTPWAKWRGREVMMSSTHDPYLPKLARYSRKILKRALPTGVRFCIQTRSTLVSNDFDVLAEFSHQVRLQISLATMSRDLARLIEPRVPPPERRLEVLRKAKEVGLRIGVIIAPVFPDVQVRPSMRNDLREISEALADIRPDHIYGESLHIRGENLRLTTENLGGPFEVRMGFDRMASRIFREELRRVGLKGTWWPEPDRRAVRSPKHA